jgi:hypothetical protein
MTGNDNGNGIEVIGLSDSPTGPGASDCRGEGAITEGVPKRNLPQALPDGELKGRSLEVERDRELAESACEIAVEFALGLGQPARGVARGRWRLGEWRLGYRAR